MSGKKTRGFTLVELLVVIGIIALLISVLLPALNKARMAAYQAKCGSNLHSIGIGIANYVADNNGTLPASYIYVGHAIQNGVQTPPTADHGYIHWSSYIYGSQASESRFVSGPNNLGIASTKPGPYASPSTWGMFQCPALDEGGLPPTNPAPGVGVYGVPSDTGGSFVDYQSPRMAYMLNEALCPRNKFVLGFQNCVRVEHYVKSGSVTHSAMTILATEWNVSPAVVTGTGEVSGQQVYKSHRPVTGFTGLGQTDTLTGLADVAPGAGIQRVKLNLIHPNPASITAGGSYSTLDWVGRNHGPKVVDSSGMDIRKSEFLYLDGHVEVKQVKETLAPWQWGDTVFTLDPNGDVINK